MLAINSLTKLMVRFVSFLENKYISLKIWVYGGGERVYNHNWKKKQKKKTLSATP